jgi:hypothetical protein
VLIAPSAITLSVSCLIGRARGVVSLDQLTRKSDTSSREGIIASSNSRVTLGRGRPLRTISGSKG